MKTCPACTLDPDPRGPSACAACRELNRKAPPYPDLSDAHVDRVARKLYRAFDDANKGHEPLHDFDVMAQCKHDGRPVINSWRALAREAIKIGAFVSEEVQEITKIDGADGLLQVEISTNFDADAWQRQVILRNVEKDPYYAPYCMRCTGLVRMRIVERHFWRCRCGAQCDYRPEPLPK